MKPQLLRESLSCPQVSVPLSFHHAGAVGTVCRLLHALWKAAARKATIHIFSCAAISVALLTMTSCRGDSGNDQRKDEEPKTGFYRVRLFAAKPDNVSWSQSNLKAPYFNAFLDPQVGEIRIFCGLRVECFGVAEFLPPDCDKNKPSWEGTLTFLGDLKAGAPFASLGAIVDPMSPDTQVTLTVNGPELLKRAKPATPLAGFGMVSVQARFVPTHRPPDLALSGDKLIHITFHVPIPVPIEAEKPPEEPSLGTTANSQLIRLVGNTIQADHAPGIIYKGPPTTIAEMTLSGSSKFSLVSPVPGTALPGDGRRIPVNIQFTQPDIFDFSTYAAFLAISTANGKQAGVGLTGRREPAP